MTKLCNYDPVFTLTQINLEGTGRLEDKKIKVEQTVILLYDLVIKRL